MIRKVLSLFLVLQFLSFALWQGAKTWTKEDAPTLVKSNYSQNLISAKKAAADSPVQPFSHMQFAARNEERQYTQLNVERKREIADVLAKLPSEHIASLKNLVLDYNPKAHRGLGGKSLIIMRAVDIDASEFFGVLIHEIGHTVDLGMMTESKQRKTSEFSDGKKPVYESDPSLDFYRISWEDHETRKKEAGNMDFVSGYALSDPFEDFAESYVYYVLHNKEFKSKTQTSLKLMKKYEFLKNEVFNGEEFETGTYLKDGLRRRPWDITVLSYDLDNFLNS